MISTSTESPLGLGVANPSAFRNQIITSLRLLGRPAALALALGVSSAHWGQLISTRRAVSLRHTERAAYRTQPGAKHEYVVTASSSDRFAALLGVVGLLSMPLEVRITGPASHRVNLLYNIKKLCTELDSGRSRQAYWFHALELVVIRLASTVPEAVVCSGAVAVGTGQVQTACDAELAVIEWADRDIRIRAAAIARAQLTTEQRLFGTQGRLTGETDECGGAK